MAADRPSEEEWLGYFERLSNWGRWGPGDTHGTLNFITDDVRRSAAALVSEGVAVSCSRLIDFTPGRREDPNQPLHFMIRTGTSAPAQGGGGAGDWAVLPLHRLAAAGRICYLQAYWMA
jgi:hypothetical protein